MMKRKYFVYSKKPTLITRRNDTGELINLAGTNVTETIPATRNRPERVVTARGATQEDLAYFLNDAPGDWSRQIGYEEVEEQVKKKTKPTMEEEAED
jgi:hypothetical protein